MPKRAADSPSAVGAKGAPDKFGRDDENGKMQAHRGERTLPEKDYCLRKKRGRGKKRIFAWRKTKHPGTTAVDAGVLSAKEKI